MLKDTTYYVLFNGDNVFAQIHVFQLMKIQAACRTGPLRMTGNCGIGHDNRALYWSFSSVTRIAVNGTVNGGTTPATAGVTVSETALTVTEEDTTGDTYTVVLDSEPTSSVTVEVGGTSGTDVTAAPASLTFTTTTWDTAQTVTVKGVNDSDTVDDMVNLTHAATSSDSDYDGFTIAGVTVEVEDNDTAQVTGVMLTPGDRQVVLNWTPVANATGYRVQWKSGGQGYSSSRQGDVSAGSTTLPVMNLTNGTEYSFRVRAHRTGANNGLWSDDALGTPQAAGVTVSETALTVTEEDTTGDTYTVVLDSEPTSSVTVEVGGTSGTDVTAAPASLTFTTTTWDTARR